MLGDTDVDHYNTDLRAKLVYELVLIEGMSVLCGRRL